MNRPLTAREIAAQRKALELTDAIRSAIAEGASVRDAAFRQGMGEATARRWLERRKAFDAGDARALLRKDVPGRPALARPTPEEATAMRNLLCRSNRGEGQTSMTLAARTFARSDACSDELAHAILKPRASKHTLTKVVKDALRLAPAMLDRHRSPTQARLKGPYVPGQLRMTFDERTGEMRRLRAGERQSWDDASINFMVCVPWQWGGDKCSDRFGVRVGRFQLLAGIDDATDFSPGFSFAIRPLGSYRAVDATAAMFRLWRDTYAPATAMVEGGVWQSQRALAFYEHAGVKWQDARGRPNCKLIESWWNRLWTRLSLYPGQIGRFRGEMERENDLLMRVQHGRVDPRGEFIDVSAALTALSREFAAMNAEPVESKGYGRWVPQELHRENLEAWPRRALDPAHAWVVAPVSETRVTRRGMITVLAESPFGEKFPYHFASENLWEFEGCRVRAYFDPHDVPCRAVLTLDADFKGRKAGHVIATNAECLDSAPAVMEGLEGWSAAPDESAVSRAIAMKKAMAALVMCEYRALGFGGRRVAATSEIRAPGQSSRIETGTRQAEADPAPVANRLQPLEKTGTASSNRWNQPPARPRKTDDEVAADCARLEAELENHLPVRTG